MNKYKVTMLTEYTVEAECRHEAIRKAVCGEYTNADDKRVEVDTLEYDIDEMEVQHHDRRRIPGTCDADK